MKNDKFCDYFPTHYQQNPIPRELWEALYKTIYDNGYICMESDSGCRFVLEKIVDILHDYKITKNKKETEENTFKE